MNYDTLLDDHLAERRPLDSIESYIDGAERWLLIKPHGSVNWGRKVTAMQEDWDANRGLLDVMATYGDDFLTLGVRDDIELVTEGQQPLRQRLSQSGIYYPALAMPVGPGEDSLTCPPEHIEAFASWLADRQIDVLVIGYIGLDTATLKVITDAKPSIRSLYVVNYEPEATQGVDPSQTREAGAPLPASSPRRLLLRHSQGQAHSRGGDPASSPASLVRVAQYERWRTH